MIHPNTRLLYINDQIGYGLFATQLIPMGTLVYVKDSLEREITPEEFSELDPEMQEAAQFDFSQVVKNDLLVPARFQPNRLRLRLHIEGLDEHLDVSTPGHAGEIQLQVKIKILAIF